MSIDIYNTGFEVIVVALFAAFLAQVIKFFIFTIRTRKINFKIFTTTGGMPSSHSSGVMGLATSVGLIDGFNSTAFAIALGFAMITMYDAAGVRRAAGKTAACLNRMMEDYYNHDVQAIGGKLKELLGHTPFEVYMGALLGIALAFYFHFYVFVNM
ncbi:divergent PAP2 family protein [bacterium]|nr:divergent PAP2 family protein [bacterium]